MRASSASVTGPTDEPAAKRRRSIRKAPAVAPAAPPPTTPTSDTAGALRETEAGFMRRIIQYAQLRGWSVFHDEHSLWNERGLPDLILARWPRKDTFARLIFAEIKLTNGKLRIEQAFWLETLRHVQGVEVHVWKPADWSAIEQTLL